MSEAKPKTPHICRLCLALTATSFSLNDNAASGMLEALTSLKILPSDAISTVMCLKCCLNLKLAFNIQQNMIKAEQRFQERRFSPPIKQEFDGDIVMFDETVEPFKKESAYTCKVCSKTWSSKGDLGKHMRAVHVQMPCPVCGKVLKKATIKRHMEEVHESGHSGKFVCEICGSEKSLKRRLDLHMFTVHGIRSCSICRKKIEKTKLKDHIAEHQTSTMKVPKLPKKKLKVAANALQEHECDICAKKYPSKDLMKRHQYNVHVTGKCPICGQVLKKLHLKAHIARHGLSNTETEREGKYVCDICGVSKFSQTDLWKHKYNNHARSECPICKKSISKTNIKRHIERHTDPLTVCELCGLSFLQQDMRYHIHKVHTTQRYKCDFCDRDFKQKMSKIEHEKREHLGQADFTCDTCGKRFFTVVSLRNHINGTHLKLRPHICDVCKVGFSSKTSLKTHQRQHTNERPYKCEFCGDGFRQKVSLKSHLKSQHGVEEELNCECKECGKKFASSVALISHGRVHS